MGVSWWSESFGTSGTQTLYIGWDWDLGLGPGFGEWSTFGQKLVNTWLTWSAKVVSTEVPMVLRQLTYNSICTPVAKACLVLKAGQRAISALVTCLVDLEEFSPALLSTWPEQRQHVLIYPVLSQLENSSGQNRGCALKLRRAFGPETWSTLR